MDRDFLLSVDVNRLKQILLNLLSNACKFTKEGSITFGVRVCDEQEVEFYVKDTGRGIPEEAHQKIFERFEKIEETGHEFAVGSGLGLSISSYLVKRMEGKVRVESQVGKGSTFVVSLPVLNVTTPLEVSKSKSVAVSKNAYQWTGKTFLVAEDISFNFRLIERILESTGVRLEWAKDGEKAIDWITNAKSPPDLMLLDIKLPKKDGFSVMLEARKKFPSVPIVAQTAHALIDEKQRILEAGFSACLAKPFKRNELLECLSSYLD